MSKKERKINWNKARSAVVTQKLGVWYEDWDEAEGEFMGWRKCKNDMPVTQSEFLKFYDKYMEDKKMRNKKTKSEIMPPDDTQKRAFDADKKPWKKNNEFIKNIPPVPSIPPVQPPIRRDGYLFFQGPIPNIYVRELYISTFTNKILLWDHKPDLRKDGSLKRSELNKNLPIKIDKYLCSLLFGSAPDKNILIGPIRLTAEIYEGFLK